MIERTEKELRQNLPANESYDSSADDDQWKWHAEKINRHERRHGDCPHDSVLERFAADADHGRRDNREHGRLQSVKDRGNRGDVTVGDINVTQRPENKD